MNLLNFIFIIWQLCISKSKHVMRWTHAMLTRTSINLYNQVWILFSCLVFMHIHMIWESILYLRRAFKAWIQVSIIFLFRHSTYISEDPVNIYSWWLKNNFVLPKNFINTNRWPNIKISAVCSVKNHLITYHQLKTQGHTLQADISENTKDTKLTKKLHSMRNS